MTTIFSFLFCNCNVGNYGACSTPLEGCLQDLSNGILQAPKFQEFQLVEPKNKMQSFSDCTVGSSKVLQWENDCGYFCNVFYECIEGKLAIYLLLAMSIGDDWVVDLMIIYIEKTIAKALDINDFMNFFTGMSTQQVQISQ